MKRRGERERRKGESGGERGRGGKRNDEREKGEENDICIHVEEQRKETEEEEDILFVMQHFPVQVRA